LRYCAAGVLEVLPFARYSILRLLFAFIMFNSLAALPAHTVVPVVRIGAPSVSAAAAKYWQQQSLEDNCGRMSVADVVGEVSGHAPTEEQMVEQYLGTDRKIIAWVNSAIIWNTRHERTKADHFRADHADEQVTIATFTNARRTGGESIVVTAAVS
jgi:hypothetical protein